ncbi:MAG: hypothetical protein TU35_004160 [Thermoproteus sp. AZ2]|jgi:hypothetical protein|uniref:Uncharacterized protein n=1 Tax=Thermoproteus sp. AZ2 TaxID=1609232 RepID=A0ACC6V0H7_9CREN|nr:MAG: hypothetical protein TU35_02795 [Thermoproteus sp. AZ2]
MPRKITLQPGAVTVIGDSEEGKDEAPMGASAQEELDSLCSLLKAYLVVREVSKEAAEVLRQEITKRL